MDDFDIPDHNIVDGISPSPFNFPEPYKRPFSSMSPAILTNDDGRVQLVIGASGGKRITTAVSLVCLMASYHDFKPENMKGTRVYSQVHHSRVIFRSIPGGSSNSESCDMNFLTRTIRACGKIIPRRTWYHV